MKKGLTVKETAKQLGISENLVRERLLTKDIKGVKVGREWRVQQDDIDSYLGITNNHFSYERELYIRDLEKENQILKERFEAIKNVLNSLNIIARA